MKKKILFFCLLLLAAAIACTMPTVEIPIGDKTNFTPVKTPLQVIISTTTPFSLIPTATRNSPTSQVPIVSIKISQSLPEKFRQSIHLPKGFSETSVLEQAEMTIQVTTTDDYDAIWVYALAAPFPTTTDDIKFTDLLVLWKANSAILENWQYIYLSQSTKEVFEMVWGKAGNRVIVIPNEQLISETWKSKTTLAIIPFEEIEPHWKILSLDGRSPLLKSLDESKYPLAVRIGFTGATVNLNKIRNTHKGTPVFAIRNRDENKLSLVVMTGVTALVRATANRMEQKGITYPGRDIRDWLVSADITHISNEVSFSSDCPPPDPYQASLFFCSAPKYLELLTYVGADVIEMSGNHVKDYVAGKSAEWGVSGINNTFDLYLQNKLLFYAAGRNQEEARQPVKIERNGHKFAFIGCNIPGPEFAWAKSNEPGAAQCDFDYLEKTIRDLKTEGYLVIATFQHYEYYTPEPRTVQIRDFRRLADAGAIIVSGSQAHSPQAMELYKSGFIHYGLGNLFFDQMEVLNTRQEFIDRHIFYDGKYLGVQLLTAMLEDYAAPRPMNLTERKNFLSDLFKASGW